MTDVIPDGLKGKLSINESLNTRMAKRMCACPAYLYACFAKVLRHSSGNGAVGDWWPWSEHTEEYMAILGLGPAGT